MSHRTDIGRSLKAKAIGKFRGAGDAANEREFIRAA